MSKMPRPRGTSPRPERADALARRRRKARGRRAVVMCFAALAGGCRASDVTALWEAGEALSEQAGSLHSPDPASAARVAEVWRAATASGFSGVVLVRHDDRELGRFAAGFRDRDRELPNTLDTAFDIGSITKQFTGAAIMRLYEQRQLSMQTSLGELFADAPADKARITVHQLLTHTAGFASALGADDELIERAAYLERAWGKRLSAEPGTLHWYSNTGYSILGAVIERSTGKPYDDYLRAELLQPLGIEFTGYLEPAWRPTQVALGYAEGEIDDPLQRPHAPDGYYWNLRANGGELSTIEDLTRWSDALLGGEVLGPDALELYLTPHVREGLGSDGYYAYGWAVRDTPAGRLVSHTGGNGFFFAEVRQYIDAHLLVVLLSNESDGVVDTLATDLAAAVLPSLPSGDELPEPEPLAVDREETFEEATQSFTQSIEFPAERDAAVAGFFVELEAGSASYRLLAPEGDVFDSGEVAAGDPTERIIAVPPRLGPWQLEIDVQEATGTAYLAWLWE